MSTIKNTREGMGMGQAEMAAYLGISRTLLSMVELGERLLPTTAHLKLYPLETALDNATAPAGKSAQAIQQQLQKQLDQLGKRAARCTIKANMLELTLTSMVEQYNQCLKALGASAQVIDGLGNGTVHKRDRSLMQLLEARALGQLKNCGLGAQALLQLKIQLLRDEVEGIGKLVFSYQQT